MLSKKIFKLLAISRNLAVASRFNFNYVQKIKSSTDAMQNIAVEDDAMAETDRKFHLEKVDVDSDRIVKELKDTRIPSKIFCILDAYENEVDGETIVQALKILINLCDKKLCYEAYKAELLTKFKNVVQENLRKLNTSDSIDILEIFLSVNGQHFDEIAKIIFHHLNCNFKNVSITDYNRLIILLKKISPTSSHDKELRDLLRRKFPNKTKEKFNENLNHIARPLMSMSDFYVNKNVLKIVVTLLKDDASKLSFDQAFLLMQTLYVTNYQLPGLTAVYENLETVILDNEDELTANMIIDLAFNIKLNNKFSSEGHYSKEFVNRMVQRTINLDVGFGRGLKVLEMLNVLRHVHIGLLNYLSAKYYETRIMNQIESHEERKNLCTLFFGLALAKHKPYFWPELLSTLTKPYILHLDSFTLCHFAQSLACLSCYDNRILEKVFSPQCDYSNNFYSLWTFCNLCNYLKTLPTYDGPMATNEQLKSLGTLNYPRTYYPIRETLEKLVGGPKFLLTDVWSKLHHRIDHMIAVQPDGHFHELNQEPEENKEQEQVFINKVDVLYTCKKILFVSCLDNWYARNNDDLLGPYELYMKSLKTLPDPVIFINTRSWYEMTPEEKENLLKTEIREVLKNS